MPEFQEAESDDNSVPEPIRVSDLIVYTLDQYAAISWQKLGLQPDMATGKIEPDLDAAKLAIDLTAHMAHLIEGELDADDRRRIQSLVRDLRLNYVNQRSEQST